MVLRLVSLAMLLGAGPLAAQTLPTRAPTRARIVADTVLVSMQDHGWFGFRQDVGRDSLVVLEVAAGSPAERAGLRKGDRITMIDGRAATPRLLTENPPVVGDIRRLTVRRGTETLTFAMVAESPPAGALMPTRLTAAFKDTLLVSEARKLRGQMALKATRGTISQRTTEPLIIVDGEIVQGRRQVAVVDSVRTTMAADSLLTLLVARDSSAVYDELSRLLERTNYLVAKLAPRENAISGAEFEQLNPGLAEYFGGVSDGVFVLRVAQATPAATADLRPGDIVQSVNGQRVLTINEMRDAVVRESGTITLHVLRKGKPATVVLRKE